MQARTAGAPGPLCELIVHPAGAAGPVSGISVSAYRPEPSVLALDYVLSGDLFRVLVPGPTVAGRADDLWRHTCFEAFICAGPGPGYHEVNLSPSGEWAVYGFDAYRQGRTSPVGVDCQAVLRASDDDHLALTAIVRLDGVDSSIPWSVGLSAVVEDADGGVSYWALAHPSARPDFHHPDSFTLILPPPEPA